MFGSLISNENACDKSCKYYTDFEFIRYFTFDFCISLNVLKLLYVLQILKLQRQLQDQFLVRHALESALCYQPLSHEAAIDDSIPKVTILDIISYPVL